MEMSKFGFEDFLQDFLLNIFVPQTTSWRYIKQVIQNYYCYGRCNTLLTVKYKASSVCWNSIGSASSPSQFRT